MTLLQVLGLGFVIWFAYRIGYHTGEDLGYTRGWKEERQAHSWETQAARAGGNEELMQDTTDAIHAGPA